MGTSFLLRSNDSSSIITNPNPNSNQSARRNRVPTAVNRSSQDDNRTHSGGDRNCTMKHPGLNLVMGQVKILKRGEKLSPDNVTKSEGCYDSILGSTDRFGPDPQTVKKQVRVLDLMEGLYAGPTSVSSPPPSSVPVPGFLAMKKGAVGDDLAVSLFN